VRVRSAVFLLLAALLTAASAAHGATVSAGSGGRGDPGSLSYSAAPGELNDVEVSRVGLEIHVRDASAPVTAGSLCRQVDEHTVGCPDQDRYIYVRLGDGGDRLLTRISNVSASGEAGDDELTGSTGPDRIDGGDGTDLIVGREGDDSLEGGAGGDTVEAGPGDDHVAGEEERTIDRAAVPAHDVLRGGEGFDTVSYWTHPAPVRADLSRPGSPFGAVGEDDEASGFETVRGGAARNELTGDDGPNGLDLSSGGGVAIGAGGNDRIGVGTGNAVRSIDAVVDAGPGNDLIGAYYSAGARIGCGPGFDVVDGSRLGTLAPDCEQIAPVDLTDIDDPVMRPHPALSEGDAVFRIRCPEDINSVEPCKGRLLMRDSTGRVVGLRRWTWREGAKGHVKVALERAARKRMARPGGLEIKVDLRISKGHYERDSGYWSIVLGVD
jgi:hypothetical protein